MFKKSHFEKGESAAHNSGDDSDGFGYLSSSNRTDDSYWRSKTDFRANPCSEGECKL